MIPSWPISRLPEAIEAIARKNGLEPAMGMIPRPPETLTDEFDLQGQWIEAVAEWYGLEIEDLGISSADADRVLRNCGPALLRLANGTFVFLTEDSRILAPDLSLHRVKWHALVAALIPQSEIQLSDAVEESLRVAGVPRRRRAKARTVIGKEGVSGQWLGGCWTLRMPPQNSWHAVRKAGLPGRFVLLVTSHAVEYALWLASWGFVGVAAFEGRFDRGWFIAWALLLLTLIPLHAISSWLQGVIAISAGGLLKERLLAGALRLTPEELRHRGAGQLLGRVMESEALESLACNGGFAALVSVVELVMAAAVLAGGAGGTSHVLILLLWGAITAILAWRYFRLRSGWTARRLAMTHDLVEHMVGHRTRLAQELPERWHEQEDQALERYLAASQHMDRAATWLSAFVPIGWLIASILVLAQPFISGSASPAGLALGIGGTLLAYQAFNGFATGLWNLSGAAIAWREVSLLFHAAARPQPRGTPDLALRPARRVKETLLDVQDVVFRYQNRSEPILRGCNLRIVAGDRMVLEGPSGGGKSTLGSLLAGWRTPSSGLVLAGGLDQSSLGFDNWRRAVVCAPQFHENHILCGPLALNLLMSRGGLFSDRDLEEAKTICQELGLGELLARMPGGMMQMVGESGWQLSHGERSRLYIARALLQRAEVIVLDESFAALDPENLRLTLDCIQRHAPAALVIAHR